jgi:polysaccharide export outer membrane protein
MSVYQERIYPRSLASTPWSRDILVRVHHAGLRLAGLGLGCWAIALSLPLSAQTIPDPVPYEPGGLAPARSAAAIPADAASREYTLGAGDQVRVDVFGVADLSGTTYTLLSDGSLTLPWVGKVVLQGLTTEQASETLVQRYRRYIHRPSITVSLVSQRPVRIGVVGEVNRPGAYVTGQSAGGTIQGDGATTPLRTVTQAIQAAGGITQLADIRNIEIHRPQLSGSEEVIRVDLWAFLQAGELNQDIPLRDGDTLIVPTVSALDPREAVQLAAANFSPETVNINVVGEVKSPGTLSLQSNTSLNQAILAAGGFDLTRARTSEVQLIRINPDGSAVRREIQVDLSAEVNEATNPALRNNDIVVVGRSGLARTGDFLNTLLGPINPFVSVFSILRIFGGN